MHKWERTRARSYATDYTCIYCGEYYQIHNDEDTIELPPQSRCKESEKVVKKNA